MTNPIHLHTCPLCHTPVAYSTVGHKATPPPNPICQSGAWYHVQWRGDDWVIFWVKGAKPKPGQRADFKNKYRCTKETIASSIIGVAK